jgi:hypothetical protein
VNDLDLAINVAGVLHADREPISVEFWNRGDGVMLGRVVLNGDACIYLHPEYVDLLNNFGQLSHDDFVELSDEDLSGAVLLSRSVESGSVSSVVSVANFVRFCARSIVAA